MIKQAIIPLAGLGTRLLPLTSVFAKELLPINGRPGIEYILDECIEAGIKEIVFIISTKKIMIKKYFYSDQFYKNIIKKKKDPRGILTFKKRSRSTNYVCKRNCLQIMLWIRKIQKKHSQFHQILKRKLTQVILILVEKNHFQ